MKKIHKRSVCALICLLMLIGMTLPYLPELTTEASAATVASEYYSGYSTISVIENLGSCGSMQGFALDGTYLYCAKIDSSESSAIITRTNKSTGDTVYMTNAATGSNYFSQLSHANDLACATISGVKTLFVCTGSEVVGEYSLVRFAIDGTKLTEVGHYTVEYNGTQTYLAGTKVKSISDTEIEFIAKRGRSIFSTRMGIDDTTGVLDLELICSLDLENSTIKGSAIDLSDWVSQGFDYIDNKIFVPMCGAHDDTLANISAILVYDIEGASGSIRNDPTLSFRITSSTFSNLFEIESCQIDPSDGKLYFNTNRRKTSSDSNHDGVHYIQNYIYDPARGDDASQHYHWELVDDKLVSVTDDGAIYNNATQTQGYITNGKYYASRFHISKSIILEHDKPWILEWSSVGTWPSGVLLFSGNAKGAYEGNQYVYRRHDSTLIALGEFSGGSYQNYGVDLGSAGFDGTVSHVYTMKNVVATDGTNMVYLYVDGMMVGAMNNYYINGESQGTTSDWVSGKDFTFSYFGSMGHPIKNCSVERIQVWGNGIPDQYDEPNIFRWETRNDTMTSIAQTGHTTNNATTIWGSCTDGVYSGYQASLDQQVTLLHDRPWSIEWKNDTWSGSALLFASHAMTKNTDLPYIYRSGGVISIGNFDGTTYSNYGIQIKDHGIDPAASHVFRLTNRIASDGSNMVYLYVDGAELGPMNNYFSGSTAQGTTSDWISGKDFTFTHMGTYQHKISGPISYIQVWEGGIPSDTTPQKYRWETQNDALTNITGNSYAENASTLLAGSCTDGVYSGSYHALEQSIVLLHDRPWSIEWQSEGSWKDSANGAMLLAASLGKHQVNAPYLYRRNDSTFIAFGERCDDNYQNYGVSLSGHGIDGTIDHTYKLVNRIADDGSNMVYLLVDGVEIGPMNEYFLGGSAQNTTNDWVNGKDFIFSYLGTSYFPIGNCSVGYLQIQEGCTHSYTSSVTTAATCTSAGVLTYTCDYCGDSYTGSIPALGHSYSSTITPPTCGQDGYTTHICSSCGNSYTDDQTAALTHSYTSSVTTSPTCTATGVLTYSCDHCGDSYTEPIAATGHHYSTTVTAPTCTTNGYTTHTCDNCGDVYTSNTITATGHSWSSGTCSKCAEVCSHTYSNNVCTICQTAKPSKDYYLFGYINGADYGCGEDWETLGEYQFIDGTLTAFFTQDSYVALKSGDNQDWYMLAAYYGESVSAGSLFNTTTGAREKLFVPAGKEITFTLIDNGDDSYTLSYTATACTHPTHDTSGNCTKCSATVGHSYGGWVETKAATCTEKGELKRSCTGCTLYQVQSIAAIGHTYADGACTTCGAADPDAVTQPTLTLKYPSLSFEAEILYNVYYVAENIDDVVEMGLLTFDSEVADGNITNATDVIHGFETDGSIWKVGTNGISAKDLGDDLYFMVYAELSDGSYVYSAMKSYSAVSYANTILGRSTSTDYMKALVVSMLNYGTEAQLYFGHNTDSLMNASLTAEQQALVGAYDESMMDSVVSVDSTKAQNFLYDGSSFTRRAPSVSFDGAFSINYYFTAANTPDDGMTLYYWNIDDYLAADVLTIDNATGSMEMVATETEDQYWGNVTGIAAKELDQTVFVVGVYQHEGVTYSTGILNYSIGRYCEGIAANSTSDQQSFAQATAVYGFYAKEYFSNL